MGFGFYFVCVLFRTTIESSCCVIELTFTCNMHFLNPSVRKKSNFVKTILWICLKGIKELL